MEITVGSHEFRKGRRMRKGAFIPASLLCIALALALLVPGCGNTGGTRDDGTGSRPESVTAYQAVQYTAPAADKWQEKNWMVEVRDGDPDGITREGKAKIWEVYYFSPRPEENAQMLVIYNRGNVWPNTPGRSKGGEDGLEVYRKEKPKDFRVDSGEAYTVALRNGGGEYLEAHPEAKADVTLRCKADYDAIRQEMPAPKYKWIWTVAFAEPGSGAEALEVLVDGMNGDFISKEQKEPAG